jgi:hypothetical protein
MTEQVISQDQELLLKTAVNIPENEPLPERVVELYWEVNRTARRLGLPMSKDMIAMLVVLCGFAPKPDPVSFMDDIEHGLVQHGDRVLGEFRSKWRWGWYRGVDNSAPSRKKVKVEFDDGNSEVRSLSPTKVRRPTKEELTKIGE